MTPTTTGTGRGFAAYTPPAPTPSIRPAPRRRPRVPGWIAPVAVGVVVCAVAIAAMTSWPVGVFYDDGIYLILGKALATGEGYRYLNLPGHPAATHYPPGYPALLALLWLVAPSFPGNVVIFKLANAVLLGLAATGLFLFARRHLALSTAAAAGAVVLGFLTIPVIAVTSVLFSEPLFLATLALALPACERALRDDARPRAVAVAALLAASATLVRSLGLPLVAALGIGLLGRRRWRDAALAAVVAGVLLLPWQAWTAVHAGDVPRVLAGGYGSYAAALGEAVRAKGPSYLARVATYNLGDIARPLGAVFAPATGTGLRRIVVAAMLALLAVGGTRLGRRAPATALFLIGYAALVIAWPYALDRFLWGIWPLVLLTLAMGASVGVAGLRARRAGLAGLAGHVALVVGALLLAVGLARYNVRGYREHWWDAPQRLVTRQLLPLVEWTSVHTRPDDVIASDGDPLLHLYTGRHVVPSARWALEAYPAAADTATRVADLRTILDTYRVRYLLLSSGQATSAPATAVLRQGPQPRLQMLLILPGGGAAFTTAPGLSPE